MFKNPIILFIWGIVSKWYIMITVAALVVTFYVFKGLLAAGVLQDVEKVVRGALIDSKSIAQHCVKEIKDLKVFWSCIQSPPHYEPHEDEKMLQQKLENFLNFDDDTTDKTKNPYE